MARIESPAHDAEPRRLLLEGVPEGVIADAVRREVNVAKAILFAEDEIRQSSGSETDQPISERSADPDWLFRWRDAASEVSAEELQHLWGRVLAGEVKSPGTFSLRTLEFLRNVSRQEGESIEILSRFVIRDFVYSGDAALLQAEGLTVGFLLALQDLGVVSGVGAIELSIKFSSLQQDSFLQSLIAGNRVLIITSPDPTRALDLPGYLVTGLGKEVCKLGTPQPAEPYLRSLGHALVAKGFEVVLASGFSSRTAITGTSTRSHFDLRRLPPDITMKLPRRAGRRSVA